MLNQQKGSSGGFEYASTSFTISYVQQTSSLFNKTKYCDSTNLIFRQCQLKYISFSTLPGIRGELKRCVVIGHILMSSLVGVAR